MHQANLPCSPASLFALLCSALALNLAGCAKPTPQFEVVPNVLMQRAAPVTDAAETWSGVVRSGHRATLSFAVAGRLQKTLVEVGDHVEAGAILAELDQESFALELAQAEAQARAAGPALEEAKRRFEAEERLAAQGATSRADRDAADSAYAAARSQQQTAEAALGLARRQQRESHLIAPRAGRIAQRLVPTASVLAAGAPVIEFDSDGPSEVVALLPANRIDTLAIGQEVRIAARLAAAEPLRLSGRITHISQRSQAGGVHEVLVRLPEEAAVFPGEAVTIEFAAPANRPGVRLPLTAIQPVASGVGRVFVFDAKTQRLIVRSVRYLSPHGSDVVVSYGLQLGELVAVAGLPFLRDGQAARPLTNE